MAWPRHADLNLTVGRSADEAALVQLLHSARIVTVTGPAGVGKSRLVRCVANQFSDGSLVVLDDCNEGVDRTLDLAGSVLRESAKRLLMTSRVPLRIAGEHVWRLAPLGTPAVGMHLHEIAATDSIQLLVARAQERDPSFQLTPWNASALGAICRTLDGLPLALELAAMRLRVLSAGQLESELGRSLDVLTGDAGMPPRHRTLAACLDASLALVPPLARRLLARLAVFEGAWTLDDARAVCADAQLTSELILPLLAELVDASLVNADVRIDPSRFSLLETTRRHARDRLNASSDAAPQFRRYAAWSSTAVQLSAPSPLADPEPSSVSSGPRIGDRLSRREREVAQLVAEGRNSREVAEALFITQATVRTHVDHIRRKLGLTRRAEIASLLGTVAGGLTRRDASSYASVAAGA